MTEGNSAPAFDLEDLLKRLEGARAGLAKAIEALDPAKFEATDSEGDSIRATLERAVDDLNFYYGRMTAQALGLPQPPCMQKAELLSLREAGVSLQVAHRRFTNLLHDLAPKDLERTAADPQHGTHSVRQLLELAAAQYRLRAQQVQRIASETARRARGKTRHSR